MHTRPTRRRAPQCLIRSNRAPRLGKVKQKVDVSILLPANGYTHPHTVSRHGRTRGRAATMIAGKSLDWGRAAERRQELWIEAGEIFFRWYLPVHND